MNTFKNAIQFLTGIAIFIAIINVYFKANKIWKRKHEKEVAESQSILALGSEALLYLLWGLSFILSRDWSAFADNMVGLVETTFFIIIGSGMFVIEQKRSKKSFWQMIKDSIKIERKEATYLLKSISGKGFAEKIILILRKLAWIDEVLDPKEEALLMQFANSWDLKFGKNELLSKPEREPNLGPYESVKKSVQDYLTAEPPISQVKGVQKLLHNLISIDGKISKEEDVIIGELDGVFAVHFDEPIVKYQVIVIPQEESHKLIIESILKDVNKNIILSNYETKVDGGFGFIMEECYSKNYAEILAQEQREQHNLMTIIKTLQENTK